MTITKTSAFAGAALSLFCLFASAVDAQEYKLPEIKTIDGQTVSYVPLSAEQMEAKGQKIAFDTYNDAGAYLYYDAELLRKLSPLAKAFVIEHEAAHHRLGHTLLSKHYRQKGVSKPDALVIKVEDDADCEATNRLVSMFEPSAEQMEEALIEIHKKAYPSAKTVPVFLKYRIAHVQSCMENVAAYAQGPQPITDFSVE